MTDFHLEPITWIIVGCIVIGLIASVIDGNSVRIPRSPRVGP
jgi:hypothetical protein